MSKTVIHTDNAPAAIGPYSQAIKANGMLFVSGQIPINPATGKIEATDIVGQTKQVFNNLKNIITAAGGDMSSIVKTTVYLQDIKDFTAMNEVYATFFTSDYPARVAVEIAKLPKGALVEVDAFCVL
ncbi:MAG: RidA family protein [Acidaminococcus sp.]|jgi:2-iminobutanoate/2-iminopropanoate deaminase|nr:RidA family protein [Acidaminococcus sp.]MCI2099603.1 RidA family protein [Acidaminococcus sp.]MCI2113688.1 RidA family protein [Acidaminococcus sp.]MCI2115771.1 RidA family protein [Acidaminococcus sp.]